MIVHKKRRALILKVRHPERITSVIPTAKPFKYKGATLVAVPHRVEETRVLRNLGIEAPSPILHYYDWPRAAYIEAPFHAQYETAAFLTGYNRAYCLNGMGCIAGDDVVSVNRCGKTYKVSMRDLFHRFHNPHHSTKRDQPWKCRSLLGDRFGLNTIEDVLFQGEKPTLRITLADGKTFRCTPDHRIMVPGGWVEAGQLAVGDTLVTNGNVEVSCVGCGKTRTVKEVSAYKAKTALCRTCSYKARGDARTGENNPAWKGGRFVDSDGYVRAKAAGHHRADQHGYVYEHILVAEATVGRPITQDLHVHHVNGNKADNRPENLEVLTPTEHATGHDPRRHLDGGRTINGGVVVVTPKYADIVSIEDGGVVDVYDLCMQAPHHNFVVNGVVVHNSGKTQSALWAYDFLRREKLVRSVLAVSPLSTLDRTWGDSIFDHFPHLKFVVLHGTRERRLKLLAEPADVYIINHDGLKVIAEEIVNTEHIDLVFVDEIAQAARNAQTDRWDYLNWVINGKPPTKQIELPSGKMKRVPVGPVGKVRGCWGLTGTPTPNEPTDAWAQCRLVTPETVPPYYNKFRDMVMRQTGPFSWVERDNAMEVVFSVMRPAIRFSREECVDLPPTTYATREVPLTTEQSKAYKDMQSKLFAEVESGRVLAVNEAVKVNKLVQIACGVIYDEHGNEATIPSKPRLEVVHEIITEAEGKVIVFVPFVSSIGLVADYLRSKKVSVEVVYGEVSKSKRDEIFTSFQKTAHPRVLVAQPAAMSHGLTLTAANTTVWYAPINSADIYEQANARTTRPGQKRNTLIVNIEGSPVERKMYKRLQTKQKMQNLLLEMVQESRKPATV